MKILFKYLRNVFISATFILGFSASADTANTLRKYVGYSIIYAGAITSWHDANGKKGDAFEGCDYGRVLILDYTKQVTCMGYGYQYSYRPNIVVLSNGSSRKLIVENDEHDVK